MPSLRQVLEAESAAHGGRLTVERFVALALHHTEHGYYARNIRRVGARGDFSTAATLSPLLGRAIAAWAVSRGGGSTAPFPLIEAGAGGGELAAAVLRHLGWWRRRRTRLHIVETSLPLREQQQAALRGRSVSWHDTLAGALRACGGRALIYHNELVDAFPPRVLERTPGGWREVALEHGEHGWREVLVESARLPESSALRRPWPPGQRVEIFESYRRWLEKGAPHWREGAMLTLDYGDTIGSLYHRRPRGTLRGYLLHQRQEGPDVYSNPGRQDITADVNFTDLVAWGERLGWKTVALETQRAFLLRHAPSAAGDRDQRTACLLDPHGMGGAVRVLEQAKAPESPRAEDARGPGAPRHGAD